ncbi:PAS domain S-box protein [Altererythrobacter salegens]|uniref:histidine kinase n=1 Tax=Croceibacterium salegens TaxID=1737568 RepID=A0A6I4STL4_9SPHN|nr:PAS domain S-box protein [Croceibacterium salegens]MXO59311.1 PAS domain S-box protein [Croceibacterium salegens]
MLEVRDFYEALVDSSDDAIVAKDTDGIVIAWNPAAERLFGWSAAEMVGNSIRRLLPEDRQDEEDRILSRIRAGERIGQFMTKRLHKDGTLLDVSVTVSPVRNAAGEVVGASKIARDAGPYLRNQARLRESEERFRLLAENMNQCAWIARPDGHIFWYNQRWYDYTGTTLEEMDGWGWTKVHHPDHMQRIVDLWQVTLAEGSDWEQTFPLLGKDGTYRWFLTRAHPIRNEAGEIEFWFGTNTDITEQREQAEQIRLLLLELNHRSKNMLSTIQALARRSDPNAEGFISRFEDRVRSLAVNQDILVRRQWREVPIDELVKLQLAFLKDTLGDLDISGPDRSLTPRAAEVIGMAMHELATNSLKYGSLSVDGGKVDIGWDDGEDGKGFRLWWRESGGPAASEPTGSGFGTTLIRDVPRHTFGAEVELSYPPEGLQWMLVADDSVLAATGRFAA